MRRDVAKALQMKAEWLADTASNPDRPKNVNAERFILDRVKALSEFTAAATYRKEPSGKYAIAFFFYVDGSSGGFWMYLFPQEGHILGFQHFASLKQQVEELNYPLNLEATP